MSTNRTALDLKPGDSGTVIRVVGDDSLRRRLNSMGLVKGASVIADHIAPLGEPRSYIVLGYQISLRKAEARNILIEPADS